MCQGGDALPEIEYLVDHVSGRNKFRNVNEQTQDTVQSAYVKSIRINKELTKAATRHSFVDFTIYHFRLPTLNIRVIFVDIRCTFEVPTGDRLLWPSNKLEEGMKLPAVHVGVE